MPIIKSAKKRVKVAAKAHARNARTRRTLREALKAYQVALTSGKSAEIAKTQGTAIRALDIAAKKSVIHKNKAARKKSQLAAQAKAAGVKLSAASPKKAVAKKPTAKKPGSEPSRLSAVADTGKAARRSTSGKPAVKRAAAPKPAKSRTSVHK